ncbi:hypothetical protein HD554DRAFT_2054077 [Boletus coccyginus]|nr:hypothetical protein HD554DRAFT_2054077 [Boletus coccyginus]
MGARFALPSTHLIYCHTSASASTRRHAHSLARLRPSPSRSCHPTPSCTPLLHECMSSLARPRPPRCCTVRTCSRPAPLCPPPSLRTLLLTHKHARPHRQSCLCARDMSGVDGMPRGVMGCDGTRQGEFEGRETSHGTPCEAVGGVVSARSW